MPMRLVRDDEESGVDAAARDLMLMDEPDTATDSQADSPDAADDDTAELTVAARAEQPDGAIDDAADSADGPEPSIDLGVLEALLFGTHHPLTAGRLAELLELESTKPIRRAIKDLNQQYADTGRSFRVEQVAGGYQLLTLPDYGEHLQRLHQREADAKLTKAALETLAIIAYKQPILRADVEAIRGVACGETIRSLMEKHLVKIAGRAEEPGRPILYGTTKRFLELFGLNSLKDLPQSGDPTKK
jgi:segregation and condensation protein B